ncbi:MAG: FtsX-like permease family protein [Propionibacteriaceae bacterium]
MTRKSLYLRSARNELIRNKGVNAALLVVLTLSTCLMATGAMMTERLVGGIDELFEVAKPPHFLQMHQGPYDRAALDRFAADHPELEDWLVEEMVGFDGAALTWHRPTTGESGDFSESLIDNLFVTQNAGFDHLIDARGAVPEPAAGEIFLPVAHQQSHDLRVGDQLVVRTDAGPHTLRVGGFVRDAQMASSMSSGTRLLVADVDLTALRQAGGGVEEIIVEYRLDDPSAAADLQHAYEADSALPKNGQAVTIEMIRMINAFSDGLVAVALMFVSLLLIAIALVNVRFVIRSNLADEVREIGTMKAIGLPDKEISRLHLARYGALSLLACLVGGGLAVVATGFLSRSVRASYAEPSTDPWTILVPLFALTLVHLIVITICAGILRRIRNIEIVAALVHVSTLDERQTARRARRQARGLHRSTLTSGRGGSVQRRLAWLDLRAERGQWALLPLVSLLATVLIMLPTNLLSTFESPRFVTYLGAPQSDLWAGVQFLDDIDVVQADLLATMQADDRLTDVRPFATVLYETRSADGWASLRVEVGDYSGGTVEFLHGERPLAGQIALSVLNAAKYGLAVGDAMTIRRAGEVTAVVVSGIYQDVTSSGYTAKLQGAAPSGATSHVIFANTVEGADPAAVATDYDQRFESARVIPMQEYAQQTLSNVTEALRGASLLALVLGVGVVALITRLFVGMHLSSTRRALGILAVIGFTQREISRQVLGKTLLVVTAGTLLGLVMVKTLGDSLVGGLISLAGLGIADLSLIPNPLMVYLAYPLVTIGAGLLGALLATTRLRGADLSSWLDR